MAVTITSAVREILSRAATDGNALTIGERLDPGTYAKVTRVLEIAGATWNRQAQAHLFPGDAGEAVAELLSRDRVTSAAQDQGWFPTPPAVAARLLELAAVEPGMRVLEPSAGDGAIAGPLAALGALVDCVELHPGRAARLAAAGFTRTVVAGDFLGQPARPVYDRVVMNPPFSKGADVAHVQHALGFVKPGGMLVTVMGAGLRYRTDRKTRALRDLADAAGGGWIEDLPDQAFRSSGTDFATVIVVIPVPGGNGEADPAEPVRVTFDRTADGLPLFSPATALPGTYVHFDPWRVADTVFRFGGHCIACGAKTWRHDHGDDDVRGAFGPHTCVPLGAEDLCREPGIQVPDDVSFPRCASCWDAAAQFRIARDRAADSLRAR